MWKVYIQKIFKANLILFNSLTSVIAEFPIGNFIFANVLSYSRKTQSKWSIANYLRRGVLVGSVWNFFQNREIIRGKLNRNGDISPLDGERQQVCKIVWCDVFSPSQKLFTAIKKIVSFYSCLFCGLINLF